MLPGSREDLAAAMLIHPAPLSDLPALWSTLESIEIRGHAYPRATREPYKTHLVSSQQHSLGVLLFLAGDSGLGAGTARIWNGSLSSLAYRSRARRSPAPSKDANAMWNGGALKSALSCRKRFGVATGRAPLRPSD